MVWTDSESLTEFLFRQSRTVCVCVFIRGWFIFFCTSELRDLWPTLTCSFIIVNAVIYSDSVSHSPSCCHKYSPQTKCGLNSPQLIHCWWVWNYSGNYWESTLLLLKKINFPLEKITMFFHNNNNYLFIIISYWKLVCRHMLHFACELTETL